MRARQIRHTPIAASKVGEDAAPGRVGQRGKGSIQQSRRIFNHLVKYIAERFGVRKHFFQLVPVCRRSLIALAAATIGQAEMTRRTAKSSASTANSR